MAPATRLLATVLFTDIVGSTERGRGGGRPPLARAAAGPRRPAGGIAVHIAARVLAAAGPGEILVSRTVRDLVTGSDVVLEARGGHHLRGVEGTWQLFAVGG